MCLNVFSHGKVDGDYLVIGDEDWERLMGQAPSAPPTIREMASNAALALARFVKSGLKVVDEDTLMDRISTCRACKEFDESARMGMGKCSAQGCGCTVLKLYMASEKCPLGKWNVALKHGQEHAV